MDKTKRILMAERLERIVIDASNKKEKQKRLLGLMDKNYKEKKLGWKKRNRMLACKIARLFGNTREG